MFLIINPFIEELLYGRRGLLLVFKTIVFQFSRNDCVTTNEPFILSFKKNEKRNDMIMYEINKRLVIH